MLRRISLTHAHTRVCLRVCLRVCVSDERSRFIFRRVEQAPRKLDGNWHGGLAARNCSEYVGHLRCRVQGSGSEFRVQGSGFRVWGFRCLESLVEYLCGDWSRYHAKSNRVEQAPRKFHGKWCGGLATRDSSEYICHLRPGRWVSGDTTLCRMTGVT